LFTTEHVHGVQSGVAKHLEHTHFSEHPPLRHVRGPYCITPTVEHGPGPGEHVAVGECEIVVLEHLSGQGRGAHNDAKLVSEQELEYGSVGLGCWGCPTSVVEGVGGQFISVRESLTS
jgi:hypothetical protein